MVAAPSRAEAYAGDLALQRHLAGVDQHRMLVAGSTARSTAAPGSA
ncbi:hypothetical protein [Mariniluteicoccus endophyticus]